MLPARTRAAWPFCFAVFMIAGCFHDFDEPFSGSGGRADDGEGGDGAGSIAGGSNTGGDRPGGSGGSSMTGLPEDCANGADDDGDSLVDCDDTTDCPGLTCIAHPGEGWEGPLVLYVGTNAAAPSCPDESAPVVDRATTLVTPAASCNTGCNCSGPTGGTCGAATITVYEQLNCGGAGTVFLTMADEVCHDQELTGPLGSRYRSNVVTATGSCSPFGSQPVIEDASLSEWGRACNVDTGGTCGSGGVCAASPTAPFQDSSVCFGRSGDHECPAELLDKRMLYESVTDERVCAPCSCDPPTGRTCDGQVHIFESAGCAGGKTEFDLDGECHSPQNILLPSSYRFDLQNPQGGGCEPKGGTVTGSVTTTGDYTLCCNGPES